MSRGRVIFWSLLLAVVGLVVAAWVSFREPRAGGEPLSYWLKLGANPAGTGGDAPSIPQSEAAIREIGYKAIPTLLAKLQATDSPWKEKTYHWLSEQDFYQFEPTWGYQERAEAIYGFNILGSNALLALPELEKLFWNTNTVWEAGQALGHLGLAALPILRAGFTNADPIFRRAALYGSMKPGLTDATLPDLRQLRHDPEYAISGGALRRLMQIASRDEATQLTIETLEGSRPRLRGSVLYALEKVSIETNRVVPVLVRLLDDPDLRFRRVVTNTLKNLDLVAAAAVGINTNLPSANTNRTVGRGRGRRRVPAGTNTPAAPQQ